MSRYHQQYSEIEKIPLKRKMFLLRLTEAEDAFEQQELEKEKARARSKMRK